MKTLHDKLVEIQSRLKVPKSLNNTFGRYKYRSNELILEAVKPLLKEHNLLLSQHDDVIEVGGRVYIKATSTIKDAEGNVFPCSAIAREAENKKGMDDSQITGTASSYARKYSLNGLFLLDDTKDCDSNENQEEVYNKVCRALDQKFVGVSDPASFDEIAKELKSNPKWDKKYDKYLQDKLTQLTQAEK